MPGTPSRLTATIVQAGAGTGKTESLARRIIEVAEILHERQGSVPRFVATTFTERATSELRERVVSILTKRENPPKWLADFVQDPDSLHISTIHGTLSLILHRFGQLLGLDPEFKILGASEERQILSRVLRNALSETPRYGLLLEHYSFAEFVDIIRDLISHKRLHGGDFQAGGGWQLIFEGDLQKLFEALEGLGGAVLSDLTMLQATQVSRLRGMAEPLKKLGQDYDSIRRHFLENLDGMRKPGIKAGARGSQLKPYLDFIFELKNDRWSEETFDPQINRRHEEVASLLSELVEASMEAVGNQKREGGFLTFDDLEFLALELISKHPEALRLIRGEWDFWFVDEFQDTSPLQKKLLFQFFNQPWNAYFVGDPQQSIYLFRGADENVFQSTKALVEQNGGNVERLAVNYRSEPDLLHFMNEIFATMAPPVPSLEAKGPRQGQTLSHVHLAGEEVDELPLIFEQIRVWRSQGHSFDDVAILVRTNDKARKIARFLGGLGVPVYVHSSGGYYDRREVLDALALLSFIEDPSDDETFILLARSPWIAVDDERLARWGRARGQLSFWDWLADHSEEFSEFRTLQVLRRAVEDADSRPLSSVFEKLAGELGFLEFCLTGDASGRREANLRKMFFTLREAENRPGFSAAHFVKNAWRELLESGEETEAASFIEPQRVNIMTIHKSKGLKFNCVIVPHCGDPFRSKSSFLEKSPDGRFAVRVLAMDSEEKVAPIAQVKLREERAVRELAESQRVFYVAVTRAAKKVSLIGKPGIVGSWLGTLGLSLGEGDHDGYQVKLWNQNPVVEKLKDMGDDQRARPLKTVEERQAGQGRRLTVTDLVRQHHLGEGAIEGTPVSPIAFFQRQVEFQQRGQAIHFIFEQIKQHPAMALDELCTAARRRYAARFTVDPKKIAGTLKIQNPPLKKIIENGFVEWSFTLKLGQVYLEGQIDLWGEVDGVTWIIDYKSAQSLEPETLSKAHEQLELYALAVHKTGVAWDKIKLAVVAPLLEEAWILPLGPKDEIEARVRFIPGVTVSSATAPKKNISSECVADVI